MWFAAIGGNWGKDDEAFLVVYPIIFAILYSLFTPLVVALVLHDSWKAIKYFDAETVQAVLDYQSAKAQEAAIAQTAPAA